MKHLLDMSVAELTAEMACLGEPDYRARQVLEWVWDKGVCQFAEMTNLSKRLRGELAGRLAILTGRVVRRSDARDGVSKLLLEWPDGERVETVVIPADDRRTACLSTQAGCPVGCAFCASGLEGLRRNLTAGEILEQLLHLRLACGERISVDDLPQEIHRRPEELANVQLGQLAGISIEEAEKELIRNTLKMVGGNREQAANILGIGERTLYRKIKEYGLK